MAIAGGAVFQGQTGGSRTDGQAGQERAEQHHVHRVSKTPYDFDDYMLQYMLKWETKESATLLEGVFKSRTVSEVQVCL